MTDRDMGRELALGAVLAAATWRCLVAGALAAAVLGAGVLVLEWASTAV